MGTPAVAEHHRDRLASVISIATVEAGETTSGRANSACALSGTTSSAWTEGHTTGPPAENAYAVDPVGVAHTMPSQPQRDSGRRSISSTTLISAPGGLLDRDVVERPVPDDDLAVADHGYVERQPLLDVVVPGQDHRRRHVERDRIRLGQEADVAEVDAEQRRTFRPGDLRGAQQGAVTAERDHQLGTGVRRSGRSAPSRARSSPGRRRSVVEHPHRDPGRAQPP